MGVTSLMNRTCTVERWENRKPDSDGVVRSSYSPAAYGVRYALQEKSGRFRLPLSGREVIYSAVAYFAPDADVRPRSSDTDAAKPDRLVDDDTGAIYYVLSVMDQTGRGKFLKALLATE